MPKPTYRYDAGKNKVYEVIATTEEKEITSDQIQQKISDTEAELARLQQAKIDIEKEEVKIKKEIKPV